MRLRLVCSWWQSIGKRPVHVTGLDSHGSRLLAAGRGFCRLVATRGGRGRLALAEALLQQFRKVDDLCLWTLGRGLGGERFLQLSFCHLAVHESEDVIAEPV